MSERGRGRGGHYRGVGDRGGGRGGGGGQWRGGGDRGGGGGYRGGGGGGGGHRGGGGGGGRGGYGGGGRGGFGGGGAPRAEEFVRDIQCFDLGVAEGQASADLIDQRTAGNLTDVEADAIALPVRPRVGTKGTPVMVLTNHFKTSLDGKKVLYQYDVCITEDNGRTIDKLPMAKARVIVAAALAQAEGAGIAKLPVAFDGQKNLFTINDTTLGGTRTLTARLEVVRGPAGAAGVKGKAAEKSFDEYQVKIQMVGERRMSEILNYVQGRDASAKPQDTINALDVVLKEEALKQYKEIGRSKFFSPLNPATIFNGLFHAYRGFFQSLRPTQSGLTLNVDQAVAAVMREQPLVEFVAALLGMQGQPTGKLDDRQAKAVSKAVKRLKVEVTHRGGGRIYTITGLSPLPANATKFMNEEVKAEQTIQTYFQTKYGKQLRFPFLHCVRIGSKRSPTYFPMEVCKVVAGQRIPNQFVPNVAADIVDIAAIPPSNRFNKVHSQVQSMAAASGGPGNLVASFGLKLEPKVVRVKGRFLPGPKVTVKGSNGQPLTEQVSGGIWTLMRKFFYASATLEQWSIVSFVNKRRLSEQDVQAYADGLRDALNKTGVRAPPPSAVIFAEDQNDTVSNCLRLALKPGKVQLIVCCIEKEVPIYTEVKRAAETVHGVMTQCVVRDNVRKCNFMTNVNISIKVNEKLGGVNCIVAKEHMQYIQKNRVMIFGADVNHARVGSMRPSFAAVTGSLDADARKHAAVLQPQSPRLEIIQDLSNMVQKLLLKFHASTKSLPHRIIFYRDGVSEGQFKEVLQYEVPAIKAACLRINPKYNPTLTFIVVQKRHNTRFFTPDVKSQDGKSGNVQAGLVVDTGVCHPIEYDFFLLSHSGLKGTSKPSYYRVLRDEAKMGPDELQQLTYFLCHNYARCTRSVSMVPAVYYSHLAAKRAQIFLTDEALASETATELSGGMEDGEMDIYADVNWGNKMIPITATVIDKMWFL